MEVVKNYLCGCVCDNKTSETTVFKCAFFTYYLVQICEFISLAQVQLCV